MSSVEVGIHPYISKVQMAVLDRMTLNIEEYDIYCFGKELQTQLVSSPEEMLTKIQQLDTNQVRSLVYINSIMTLAISPVITGFKGLGDWAKI